jgi:hypothetical protein
VPKPERVDGMAVPVGRIVLPEGNANNHATAGVLDVWTVPAPR